MEVCGGQTHSLLRHGIDAELEGVLELIHGPGCPVCVTPLEAIDFARELEPAVRHDAGQFWRYAARAGQPRQFVGCASFMGGNVRAVYSPLDAVELARRHPRLQVVFFAVGFETTTPTTALAVRQAAALAVWTTSVCSWPTCGCCRQWRRSRSRLTAECKVSSPRATFAR